MSVFVMPSLGADMEDGKLVEWLVKPGDAVHRGDVVAVVETQKGAIEIEIFEDGIVQSLEAELGATLPVGAPLALIGDGTAAAAPEPKPEPKPAPPPAAAPQAAPAEPQPAEAKPEPEPQPEPEPEVTETEVATPAEAIPIEAPAPVPEPPAAPVPPGPAVKAAPVVAPVIASGQVAASPAARALAAEKGIDLAGVAGSWPGGAIVLADVERAAGGKAEAAAPRTPPARPTRGFDGEAMRQGIAAAMTRSKREIPHYYMTHEVDLQRATDWLTRKNADVAPADRLLMGALFVKVTALAAREVDGINGSFENGAYAASETVNAGVAVALRGGGLVAPAIAATDGKTLAEVMAAMRDLVARARAGRLRSSEMTSGTITISSLGERGVDQMTGVIYPPQVALVTFGTPRAAARVVEDAIRIRQVVSVTLAADHRTSDGRRGARFLTEIDKLLQAPEAL